MTEKDLLRSVHSGRPSVAGDGRGSLRSQMPLSRVSGDGTSGALSVPSGISRCFSGLTLTVCPLFGLSGSTWRRMAGAAHPVTERYVALQRALDSQPQHNVHYRTCSWGPVPPNPRHGGLHAARTGSPPCSPGKLVPTGRGPRVPPLVPSVTSLANRPLDRPRRPQRKADRSNVPDIS